MARALWRGWRRWNEVSWNHPRRTWRDRGASRRSRHRRRRLRRRPGSDCQASPTPTEWQIPSQCVASSLSPLGFRECAVWIASCNLEARAWSEHRFADTKDELWWNVREAIRLGDLALLSAEEITQWGCPPARTQSGNSRTLPLRQTTAVGSSCGMSARPTDRWTGLGTYPLRVRTSRTAFFSPGMGTRG